MMKYTIAPFLVVMMFLFVTTTYSTTTRENYHQWPQTKYDAQNSGAGPWVGPSKCGEKWFFPVAITGAPTFLVAPPVIDYQGNVLLGYLKYVLQ
jgi:hypothetical protein